MKLLFLILVVFISRTSWSFCDPSDREHAVSGKFKVLVVQKAKVICGRDQDDNVLMHDEPLAPFDGCEVKLQDMKTKKTYLSYAGKKGCAFKKNEIRSESVLVTCCGMENEATCDLRKPMKVLKPKDLPLEDHEWFCVGNYGSLVRGTVNEK